MPASDCSYHRAYPPPLRSSGNFSGYKIEPGVSIYTVTKSSGLKLPTSAKA